MRLIVFAAAIVLAASVQAQGGTPPRDTLRKDTAAVARPAADTVKRPVRDSVKTPYAVADVARALSGATIVQWERDEIFQSGAMNAAELIERIPGVDVLRSGVLMAPQVVTWFGEPGRVRIFLDGVEVDDLNARDGTVRDLGVIPVWKLEEVVAESTPAELRVHMRTWRVDRTTPFTRVDVLTGDQSSNAYRGYFGRRFATGLGIQFGFQQLSSRVQHDGGDGDGLSLFGRVGWARGAWSVDATTQRDNRTRNPTVPEGEGVPIPAYTANAAMTYARIAWRTPEGDAPWLQLIAASASLHEHTPFSVANAVIPADSADTTATRPQVLLTGGFKRFGVHTTAIARYRRSDGADLLSPALRLAADRGRAGVQFYAERSAEDSLLRADVLLRYDLLRRLSLSAQVSRRSRFDDTATVATPAALFERVDLHLRLGSLTIGGGVIRRDTVVAAPPDVFARGIVAAQVAAATGALFTASWRFYKALSIDAYGTNWPAADVYRPQNTVSARVGLNTEWRSHFPHGDFTIRAYFMVDHRGGMLIPLADGLVTTLPATPMSSMLEIRIKSATITWQYRNAFGAQYETVPGFSMPSRINFYGVRWYFSN